MLKILKKASISQSGASNSPIKQNTYTELAEAKQRIRMLRQEIADKEELAELSQNEMEIAKQREIEQKDEIQKIRSQLLKARLDQDEIDELRTKGIKPKIWPFFFFENFQILSKFSIFLSKFCQSF